MRRTWPIAVAVAAVVVSATAACDTSGSSGGSASASADGKQLSDVTIGFAQRQLDAPYYSAMVKQAQAIAKEKGFKLLVQNANGDPVTQINQINTMVSQGVDLLVVDAVSPQAEKSQLAQVAKQTPLMFIDTGIEGVGFTSVQSDNVKIGTESGKLLASRIGSGKSVNVAILNGGPTDEIVGPDRQKGILDGLKEGGVTANVVASSSGVYAKDKAVPATEDMLSAHPDINVVIGLNDAMALGALDVLRQQGRNDVLVAASADGQKEALEEIKTGGCTGQYVSTGLNSPKLATDEVMQIAEQVTTGKKKTSDFPANSYTKVAGIGCDNVNDYYDPNSVF
jgi:ABC-type sugar transport system substrate-binding protein